MQQSKILIEQKSPDYELLDSGEGEKLERFGDILLARPDPQALWPKRLAPTEWKKAGGTFSRDEKKGSWTLKKDLPERWQIRLADMKFWIKPTPFKHVGIFPEQTQNWNWLKGIVSENAGKIEEMEILNLFGYTGGASLACAAAGAKVVHVDGSKAALTWARDNADLSGLADKPIRWILDDAYDFVKREIKRGRKYHGIVMDPPSFGHGPDGQLWKIEENFLPFLADCYKLLDDKAVLFLINGYASGYSAIAYKNNLIELQDRLGGKLEWGELALEETAAEIEKRYLPCGIFARWQLG